MKSQLIDRILLVNSIATISIQSAIEGYILNCRCEGKSEATIKNYQYRLKCFIWFCQVNVLVHMISDTLPPFFFADIVPEIVVV